MSGIIAGMSRDIERQEQQAVLGFFQAQRRGAWQFHLCDIDGSLTPDIQAAESKVRRCTLCSSGGKKFKPCWIRPAKSALLHVECYKLPSLSS